MEDLRRRTIRQAIVFVMVALMFLLSLAGPREYRRSQWRRSSGAWVEECMRGIAGGAEAPVLNRVCTCELDYIKPRWTPASFSRNQAHVIQVMEQEGVFHRCVLAAGFRKAQPQ
jgi:hypothetical protein